MRADSKADVERNRRLDGIQAAGLIQIKGAERWSSMHSFMRSLHARRRRSQYLPLGAHYSGHQRLSCFSGPPPVAISVIRKTSKITAVDQPNNSTPFIAVIGPSKCQRSTGVTSP